MNTGTNRVKKALASITAVAISSLISAAVLADPNQLDILGLVPGVSELTQVQQAGVVVPNIDPQEGVRLKIGGYEIPCSMSFLNGTLASLVCFTGNVTGIYSQHTASNTEVHSTLTAGFTKKFGNPDSVSGNPVRTKAGVEYEQQFVTWKDKRGNKLQLVSIADTVHMGLITLESSEYLKQKTEKNAADEARKKF